MRRHEQAERARLRRSMTCVGEGERRSRVDFEIQPRRG
jgi:hypothetical protein